MDNQNIELTAWAPTVKKANLRHFRKANTASNARLLKAVTVLPPSLLELNTIIHSLDVPEKAAVAKAGFMEGEYKNKKGKGRVKVQALPRIGYCEGTLIRHVTLPCPLFSPALCASFTAKMHCT